MQLREAAAPNKKGGTRNKQKLLRKFWVFQKLLHLRRVAEETIKSVVFRSALAAVALSVST